MAEYGGKQRKQLSKVIGDSESKDVQLKRFIDNRPQAASQMNLIRSIQKKPNNTGLPDSLKSGVENLSGYSMDDVNVHYNSDKPAQLNALAYTQGTDINVAPGQEKHLPHEAWHVVQQKQGRVQPTIQLQGTNVNDNEGLEKEADVMGGKASSHLLNQSLVPQLKSKSINDVIIQRVIKVNKEEMSINKLKTTFHQLVKGTEDASLFLEYDFHIGKILVQLSNLDASFDDIHQVMLSVRKILLEQISFEETSFNLNQIFRNNGIDYVIQGSYAAQLYGAPINSGDIDYIVSNLTKARQLLDSNPNYEKNGGSGVVFKYKNIKTGVNIDITYNREFGIDVSCGVSQGGVKVLPLTQVLISLCLRPEKRVKEATAYQYLVDFVLPSEQRNIFIKEGEKHRIYESTKNK